MSEISKPGKLTGTPIGEYSGIVLASSDGVANELQSKFVQLSNFRVKIIKYSGFESSIVHSWYSFIIT